MPAPQITRQEPGMSDDDREVLIDRLQDFREGQPGYNPEKHLSFEQQAEQDLAVLRSVFQSLTYKDLQGLTNKELAATFTEHARILPKPSRSLHFDYASDVREFAKEAEGGFSFRVPNGSQSAELYGTIPNPKQPYDMQTAQSKTVLKERYDEHQEATQRQSQTPEYVRSAEVEPEQKKAPEYGYSQGMGQ